MFPPTYGTNDGPAYAIEWRIITDGHSWRYAVPSPATGHQFVEPWFRPSRPDTIEAAIGSAPCQGAGLVTPARYHADVPPSVIREAMNPRQLAAEYSDFRSRLNQHRLQLDEYNLGRYEAEYTEVINRLDILINELEMFR